MVEKYLFFNSTFDDRRRYGALDMAEYWRSFLSTGLIHADGKPSLRVRANGENMTIRFDDGRALIFGHLYLKEGDLPFTLSPSSATEDRFDRIILRYDNIRGKDDSRYIRAFLVEGTADGPPELMRFFVEDEPIVYELSLAQIHVKAGKSFIEQSDIIDERLDEDLCGLASSLVTVPTDILTEEWKEFVAEYNKWFANLQGSAFATVDDVRASENNMKREIANLNLQIEANKRVKNGITFGTNFADSFGMEMDMARTSSDEALEVGQTVITVRDASEFTVETEVTIFDDVNLERVNIASINGNDITLEAALTKDYQEGVNIARTSAVADAINGFLEFGDWGTYEEKDLVSNPIETPSASNSVARFNGAWYTVSSSGLYKRGDKAGVWERITDATNNSVLMVHHSSITLMYYDNTGKEIVVKTFDKDDNMIDEEVIQFGYSPYYFSGFGIDEKNGSILMVCRNLNSYTHFYKADVSHEGLISVSTIITNTNHLDAMERYAYLMKGSTFYLVGIKDNIPRVFKFENNEYVSRVDLDSANETSYGSNVNYIRSVIFESDNGEFWVVMGASGIKEFKSDDLINWSMVSNSISSFISGSNKNDFIFKNGILFAKDRDGKIFKRYIEDSDWGHIYTVPVSSNGEFSFLPINQSEDDKQFCYFRDGTVSKIYGNGELGYGSEITTNDIRFKVKPSKEVVTWIQHDEGLTVTEATFGNINLDLSTLEDETQAVGYTTIEQDEVRLTIERESIDDDVKAYRILGGVS